MTDAPIPGANPSPPAWTGRRVLWLLLKILIVVLVAWGVRRTLLAAWHDLERQSWQLTPTWLLPAALLYLAGLLPCAWFWRRLLRALDQRPPLLATLRAYYVGHLGKYVPGKAMVVVLRAGILRALDVDIAAAATTALYETLTMMSVGALVATLLLVALGGTSWLLIALAASLWLATAVPIIPRAFARLTGWAGIGRRDPESLAAWRNLPPTLLLRGWVSIAAGWLLVGLSLWCVLHALELPTGPPSLAELPRLVAAVALAVVAGFLSLIPGGALVREAVLLELLAPRYGEAGAAVAAVLLRVVWLLSELAISAILYASGPRHSGGAP